MANGEKTAARLEALTAGGDAEELANQLDVISNREIRADQRHPWQDVTAKGADMLRSQAGQIAALREALQSIASNTCCDTCREAALVAKRALLARASGV